MFCDFVRYLNVLGRYTYVTPSSYLELLSSFKRLITQKQESTMKAKKRYLVGLEKLAFASSQVRLSLVFVTTGWPQNVSTDAEHNQFVVLKRAIKARRFVSQF